MWTRSQTISSLNNIGCHWNFDNIIAQANNPCLWMQMHLSKVMFIRCSEMLGKFTWRKLRTDDQDKSVASMESPLLKASAGHWWVWSMLLPIVDFLSKKCQKHRMSKDWNFFACINIIVIEWFVCSNSKDYDATRCDGLRHDNKCVFHQLEFAWEWSGRDRHQKVMMPDIEKEPSTKWGRMCRQFSTKIWQKWGILWEWQLTQQKCEKKLTQKKVMMLKDNDLKRIC